MILGTLRFASALLLNFIVALSNENGDGSGFFEDAQAMRDIASALCSVMELDAPAGAAETPGASTQLKTIDGAGDMPLLQCMHLWRNQVSGRPAWTAIEVRKMVLCPML